MKRPGLLDITIYKAYKWTRKNYPLVYIYVCKGLQDAR